MADNYNNMKQKELRAACKAAGVVGYGNMDLESMRACLRAAAKPSMLSDGDRKQIADEAADRKAGSAPKDDFTMSDEELARQRRAGSEQDAKNDAIVEGRTADLDTLGDLGMPESERCPHCGEKCLNNVSSGKQVVADGGDAAREYVCEDCGGEWGPKLAAPATIAVERGGAIVAHNTELPKEGLEKGFCPHCRESTRNGHNVTEYSEMAPSAQRDTNQQYTCNSCAGEWGPVVDKPKPARAPSGTSNGLKIEANRETRNGVTRPSIGGKCRGVWDMLDGIGTNATAKQAREAAVGRFDKTTTMVQFYKWRKFNGIEGRQ